MARTLTVEIIGDSSSLQAALGKAAADSEGFGSKMQAVGAKVASVGKTMTMGMTLPIVAAGAAATKMALDFSSSMELVHTQAGASQAEVDKMSGSILKLVQGQQAYGQSATDMSQGLFMIESEGYRGASALNVLKVAAAGAAVGQISLSQSADALTSVLKVYKVPAGEAAQAMSTLNAIVGTGKMHMDDLTGALKTNFLPVTSALHIPLEQAGAALDVFTQRGVPASRAATNLSTSLIKILSPTAAGQKALEGIGLTFQQLQNSLKSGGLPAVLDQLQGQLSKFGTQGAADLITAFGGAKGGSTMLSLVQGYSDYMKDLQNVQQQSNPASFWSDVASAMNEPEMKIKSAINSLEATMIQIGLSIAPVVAQIAAGIAKLASAFDSLSPSTQKMILIAAGIVAALGPVIFVIGTLTTALGVLLSPVALVIGAIALLVGGIAAAVIWPDKLKSVLESMGLSASAAGEVVSDLRGVFELVENAGEQLVSVIRDNWSTISGIISAAVGIVQTVITATVSVIESLWSTFGNTLVGFVTASWNNIKEIISGALEVVRGIFDVIDGLIHGDWSQMWQGIEEIVGGAWKMIKGEFDQAVTDLTAAAKLIWDGIKAVFSGAATWFVGIGKDLMEGLKTGILAGAEDVYDSLKHIGSKVISIAKDMWHSRSPSRDFMAIGNDLMAGLAIGVDDGSKTAISSLTSAMGKAKAAIDAEQPLIEQAAKLLGVTATEGIVNGALGVQSTATSQLKTALNTAMTNALAIVQDSPEIQAAGSHIGAKAAQAVVDGVVGKKQTMATQIRTALTQAVQQAAQGVQSASSGFGSAFDSLGSSILSAFDNVTSAYVAPAQKILNADQLQDQMEQYQSAVQTAAAQVQADQEALTAAQAGGDPATISAAQAQLLSDQAAYQQANRQLVEANLAQTAATQTAAYDKQRATQRESLAKQLADLRTELAKNPKEWAKMGTQVEAILKTYSVPLYTAGQKFASDFASGISSQISAAEDAAKALADAVAKYIPKSPARTGPLAFSSLEMGQKFGREFANGIAQGLYGGAGMSNIAGSLMAGFGSVGSLGSVSSLGASQSGGTVNVSVTVNGSLMGSTPNEIAQSLLPGISQAIVQSGNGGHPFWRGVTKSALGAS